MSNVDDIADFASINIDDIPDIEEEVNDFGLDSAIKDIRDAFTNELQLGGKKKDVDSILDELFSDDANNQKETTDSEKSEKNPIPIKNVNWIPLQEKWRVKIMSDKFYAADNKGSLASALGTSHEKLVKKFNRYVNSINNNEFMSMLSTLRSSVKTKRELNKEIKRDDFIFTTKMLPIIVRVLGLDVIVLGEDYRIQEFMSAQGNDKLVLVLESEGLFSAVGYKKVSKVSAIFPRNNLPNDIITLIDQNRFLTKHFEEIMRTTGNLKNQLTLNAFMTALSDRLQHNFTSEEKKEILKLFNLWLYNKKFFSL
uniref:Uncharacterized protein n=1 Tax=viral metagenome TaxID=1070528 RepID=A0A6C0DZ81_9ZZZZ